MWCHDSPTLILEIFIIVCGRCHTLIYCLCIFSEYFGYMDPGFGHGGMRGRGGRMMVRKTSLYFDYRIMYFSSKMVLDTVCTCKLLYIKLIM